MSSRKKILGKLKSARQPFVDIPTREEYLPAFKTLPTDDLLTSFVQKATALACQVAVYDTPEAAIQHVLKLIGNQKQVAAWDFEHIPLAGLEEALVHAKIERVEPQQLGVEIGITGVDVALAASGSLVLKSGQGQGRQVSLLPYTHIAILEKSKIVRDLETWLRNERTDLDALREISKINIISGPSRTADIAMTLVMGAHGPAQLHITVI